ncbi:MAG: hypothetical protein NT085_00840 [candidate division SR1 bacterium]|nr:hypothetical protein [candidate division SR1 bacterium]
MKKLVFMFALMAFIRIANAQITGIETITSVTKDSIIKHGDMGSGPFMWVSPYQGIIDISWDYTHWFLYTDDYFVDSLLYTVIEINETKDSIPGNAASYSISHYSFFSDDTIFSLRLTFVMIGGKKYHSDLHLITCHTENKQVLYDVDSLITKIKDSPSVMRILFSAKMQCKVSEAQYQKAEEEYYRTTGNWFMIKYKKPKRNLKAPAIFINKSSKLEWAPYLPQGNEIIPEYIIYGISGGTIVSIPSQK